MEDYEYQYEEYKQSILQNRHLRNELHEKYLGSLRVEKDYVDENGVLWKVGVLSCVCGLCLSLFWILEDRSDTRSIITRIILFAILVTAFVFAMHIGSKFKKNLGEMIFYAFRYHKHFEDHIQKDKSEKTKDLMEDLLKKLSTIQHRAKVSKSGSEIDMDEVIALLRFIENMDDYKTRYDDLSKYDSFVGSLKNDYYFNAEVQKDIDKYI